LKTIIGIDRVLFFPPILFYFFTETGRYVIAVFNSQRIGASDGAYALSLGREITLTFSLFMLGPFHAFFTYEWQGWAGGLILIPYWIILFIMLIIIGHQSIWSGNSPRSYYSFFVCIGGYLVIGSGCVVTGQLAYSFLQVSSPVQSSIITVAITAAMLVGPIFCGIMLVFFGLMHRANLLIRFCVAFLAIASSLVWASYYIGPGIALIGAFLPSEKWVPLHWCVPWLKGLDDEERETTIRGDADIDWDKRYEEEEKSKEETRKRQAAEDSRLAAQKANRDAIDEEIENAISPGDADVAVPEAAGPSSSGAAKSTGEAPFSQQPPIVVVPTGEESDESDNDAYLPASSSGVHQPQRDVIDS
jgi:hypothetical protein